jgi:hypothetical protein
MRVLYPSSFLLVFFLLFFFLHHPHTLVIRKVTILRQRQNGSLELGGKKKKRDGRGDLKKDNYTIR